MKVLINAFAFSPYKGSEHAVGWNIAVEMAKLHEVTVIFGDVWGNCKTQKDMERYSGSVSDVFSIVGLKAVYVRPGVVTAILTKLHQLPGCWMLYYWAYNLWQRKAYRIARKLHAVDRFDVVHHLNMIGYREPGYMWKLGIPFVWGPVGGAPNEPFAYRSLFSWHGLIRVFARTVCNEIQKRFNRRAKQAARRAARVWAVTDADYRMIHDMWGVESCQRMIEAGADGELHGEIHVWNGDSPLRIVWSGIHTSRKALPILLYALARLEPALRSRLTVEVLGEGPETEGWKRLALKLNVDRCLSWRGRVPRSQALDIMRGSHLLACPSVKEASSIVVIEAVSLGLPVICHDACGMGIVIDENCGLKVPLCSPETSIEGFAVAIKQVMNDPRKVEVFSRGALERAKELTWEAKAREISGAYEQIVKNGK